MQTDPAFNEYEKLAELKRELAMRKEVYPGLIRKGRLDRAEGERRISLIEDMIRDYAPPGLFDQEENNNGETHDQKPDG